MMDSRVDSSEFSSSESSCLSCSMNETQDVDSDIVVSSFGVFFAKGCVSIWRSCLNMLPDTLQRRAINVANIEK